MPGLRALKGRRTGIGPAANSGPASRQGREQSSSTCPGGCASLHHRLISVAPPGRDIASLSLPAVSGLAALHTLRVDALHTHSEKAVEKELVTEPEEASLLAPSAPIVERRRVPTALLDAQPGRPAVRHRRGRYVPAAEGYKRIRPPVRQPWRAPQNSRARRRP